jgi:hypothetical protein
MLVIFMLLLLTDLVLNNGTTLQAIVNIAPKINKEQIMKESINSSHLEKQITPFLAPLIDSLNKVLTFFVILASIGVFFISLYPIIRGVFFLFKFASTRLFKMKSTFIDAEYWDVNLESSINELEIKIQEENAIKRLKDFKTMN